MRGCLRLAALSFVCLAGSLFGGCVVSALPQARVTVAGRVSTRLRSPVTVTIALPHHYGLTAQERRAGMAPLNEERSREVVLGDGHFEVSFPPVRYCTRMWMWKMNDPPPPPPVWLVLHFSDEPDELYTVFKTRDVLDYVVGGPDGGRWSKDQVSWRLVIGGFARRGDGRFAPWVLDLEFVPQARQEAESATSAPSKPSS